MGGQAQDGEEPIEASALALTDWCRQNLHQPIADQHQKLQQKLQGHYAYYGITGNFPSLQQYLEGCDPWRLFLRNSRSMRHWLSPAIFWTMPSTSAAFSTSESWKTPIPASDASWDARRLRAIVVFYTKGKTPALEYVEQLILNNQAPSAWRDRYKHLDDQMKAARGSGSP